MRERNSEKKKVLLKRRLLLPISVRSITAKVADYFSAGMCMLQLVLIGGEVSGSRATWRDTCLLFVGAAYIVVGIFAFGLAFALGIQHILHPDSSQPLCV